METMEDLDGNTRDKVVRLYALGHNQSQIAQKLGITQPAVSHHVRAAQAEWRQRATEATLEDELNRQLASYDHMLVALEPNIGAGDWKSIDTAGRISQLKAKLLGLDHVDRMNERMVRVREAEQQLMTAAVIQLFDHLGLTGERREEALGVLERALTAQETIS